VSENFALLIDHAIQDSTGASGLADAARNVNSVLGFQTTTISACREMLEKEFLCSKQEKGKLESSANHGKGHSSNRITFLSDAPDKTETDRDKMTVDHAFDVEIHFLKQLSWKIFFSRLRRAGHHRVTFVVTIFLGFKSAHVPISPSKQPWFCSLAAELGG